MASIFGKDGRTPHNSIPKTGSIFTTRGAATLILVLVFGSLSLVGCSKSGNNAAPADGSTTDTSSNNATPPADNASAAPVDSKPSDECVARGKAATEFAQERDKGVGLDQVIIEIEKTTLPEDEKGARKDVARQLYHDPFAAKLSPDNAGNNFQGACTAENAKRSSGALTITAADDIEKNLAMFKTFSGQSLTDLFGTYGITVQSLQVTQSDGSGNYKSGDTVYTLTLNSAAHADTPCHLQKWVGGDITPTPEFIRRGPAFPLIRPDEDDPLIYWAATGKCSTAFNN